MAREYDFEKYMQDLNEASSDRRKQPVPKTVCPRSFKKKCFICDKVDRYLSKIDNPKEWSSAKRELANEGFWPNERFYMNIIIIADDPLQVYVFEAPPTIGKPLAALQNGKNPDYVDFMHWERGRNIYIEKEGGGRFAKYKVVPRPNVAKIPDAKLLRHLTDLSMPTAESVMEIVSDPNIRFTRPSQFDDDSATEIRVMPNWAFIVALNSKDPEKKEKYNNKLYPLFLRMVKWHYGVNPDEFEMYASGEIALPFLTASQVIEGKEGAAGSPGEDDIPYEITNEDVNSGGDSAADAPIEDDLMSEVESNPKGETMQDPCFGEHQEDSFFCEQCDRAEACKAATNK